MGNANTGKIKGNTSIEENDVTSIGNIPSGQCNKMLHRKFKAIINNNTKT
jgi:hypothetical protein